MSDNQLAEFLAATSASAEDARLYLERANGDLQLAVTMFFAEQPENRRASRSGSRSNSQSVSSLPESGSRTSLRSSSASRSRLGSSSSLSSTRARIATLSDLTRANEEALADASPSDDPAQFFTGGERSGLAVTNPNDRRASSVSGGREDPGNLVDEIIRKAQQRGPEDESAQAVPASRQPAPRFSGRGFRLGSESEQALEEDDEEEYEDDEDDQPVLQRTMYFWRNGFSIDDGPLFRFDDPQNAIYLRAINMGRAPIELLKVNPHQPVDVKLVQKPDEDYEKPKVPPTLENAGQGQRLGSAVSVPPMPAAPQPAQASQPAEPAGSLGQTGDAAVQLRMADGSARRLRFDSQGPVQQLYDYVDALNLGRPYTLQTPVPPRPLQDREQSLQSAGVVAAVVLQRWV